MNDPLKIFLISSVKTALISAIAAFTAYLFGGSPVLWFIISMLLQYVGFYLFSLYLEYKSARDVRIMQLKEAEIMAQNTVSVECASCKKTSDVLVKFGTENRFICGHCDTKNSVYLFAETAVVTEPKYETEPIVNTSSTNGL